MGFMHTPKSTVGRVGRGKSPKHHARPQSASPVRMTNPIQVMRKGSRGKSRR